MALMAEEHVPDHVDEVHHDKGDNLFDADEWASEASPKGLDESTDEETPEDDT